MKKRTVKDFIALYAPEDEEKLVLIQDGISADKTFLDTFWAAHTHALAMADVQTGQVISGRCYLSWPLTDKERDAGGYSKRFAKGQIYRIKARGWKGDALSEPQWYVTEVLEEGVPCPALEEIWTEYTKPILLEDEVLGTLTLDREMSTFEGTCKWMGNEVHISLDVDTEKKASWTRVTNVMKKLVAEQEAWDKSLRAMAAQKLTAQANEWLADNDQTDRDPEKDPITEDEFARRILLTEFTVSPGGRFTAWWEHDEKNNKVSIHAHQSQDERRKQIITDVDVLRTVGPFALCRIGLITGRTHQIRAHLAYLGKPVLGDIKYGNRKMNERTGTKTQALCAVRVRFLDIPEENTLHYLSGKVIKLKDPQILKQFDALDKNKENAHE